MHVRENLFKEIDPETLKLHRKVMNELMGHYDTEINGKLCPEKKTIEPKQKAHRNDSIIEARQADLLKKLIDDLIDYKKNSIKANFQQIKIFPQMPCDHEIEKGMLAITTQTSLNQQITLLPHKNIIDVIFCWRRNDFTLTKKLLMSYKLPECISIHLGSSKQSCVITDPSAICKITQFAGISVNEQLTQLLRLKVEMVKKSAIEKQELIKQLKQITIIALQSCPNKQLSFFSSLFSSNQKPVSFATTFGRYLRMLLNQEKFSQLGQIIHENLNLRDSQSLTYGQLREFARGQNDQSLFVYCDSEMRILLNNIIRPNNYPETYAIKMSDNLNKVFNRKTHKPN